METTRSQELFRKARKLMPGGVSSPVRAFRAVKSEPIYIKNGSGAWIEDVDGNKYIDYVMSFGPLILGHAPSTVLQAIIETAQKGTSFGTPVSLEVELAEKITRLHPAMDWVRFVNSGTEAVMSAIRLARGVTNRNVIVKFEGCYHGHVDPLLTKAGSGLATFGIADSLGIPSMVAKDTIVLQLGNEEQLRTVFEEHGEQIAAVIIEGVPANMGLFPQTKQFMHRIEELTRKHGALFILDEVITGFRLGLQGATAHYGLHPDLVTMGKIIGGGLPVGAYGGKKEYMEFVSPLGGVYQAGTLSGNPLAMAAGNSVLDILMKNPSTYKDLEEQTADLKRSILNIAHTHGIPLIARAMGSILWIAFQEHDPAIPTEVTKQAQQNYAEFHYAALNHGLYLPPSAFEVWFLSTQHDDSVKEQTIRKLTSVFSYLAEKGLMHT